MNKFSIYQYLLILAVLIVGTLYALPNLYPTQPSIQVAYTDSGRSADQSLLNDLENILEKSQTDYDDISATTSNNTKVTADIDTNILALSVARNF